MRHPLVLRIFLLAVFVGASAIPARAQTPVPYTVFHIHGTLNGDDGTDNLYRGYRNPGDKFRIVCPEPCTADQNAIYGLYAGFKNAYQTVVGLFGSPADVSQQPFDLHILDDHWCGSQGVYAAESASYLSYSGTTGSYACFWFPTGNYIQPFHYPETSTPQYNLITAHEFTHTMFFMRHHKSYEDFAKAVSFYVSDPRGSGTLTDPCDNYLDNMFQGKLVWGLCKQSGFSWSDLAPAMTTIINLFTAGKGTSGSNHSTSVFQFQRALTQAVGKSTVDAFMAAKEVDQGLIGDIGVLPYGGGRASAIAHWVSFLVSTNALTANFPFAIQGIDIMPGTASPPGLYQFRDIYEITGRGDTPLHFEDSVYTEVKYDPSLMTFGTDESTLRMYKYNGSTWQLVAGSHADADRHMVSAPITSPGFIALSASASLISPTQVIPRAVSTSAVHTRLDLRNSQSPDTLTGTIVFHPQGAAATASDPSTTYTLAPGAAVQYDDVISSLGATGSGSIDIVASTIGSPDAFAANIETGTSMNPGSIVPVVSAAGALVADDRTIVTAPGNLTAEHFAVVIRTFGAGVTFDVTGRDATGATLSVASLTYGPNTEVQVQPTALSNGTTVHAGESFDIHIDSGSAIVELETASQGMASHTFKVARRIDLLASGPGDELHLPKAVSVTNSDSTTVRTALQITNPSAATITGRVRVLPADGSGAAFTTYSLAPFATRTYSDVMAGVHKTGAGAINITSLTGVLPVVNSQIIYEGSATSWQVANEAASDDMDILHAGDRAVMLMPSTAGASARDLNMGVRTFDQGLSVTIHVRGDSGYYIADVIKTYGPNTTVETAVRSNRRRELHHAGRAHRGADRRRRGRDLRQPARDVHGRGEHPASQAAAVLERHRVNASGGSSTRLFGSARGQCAPTAV